MAAVRLISRECLGDGPSSELQSDRSSGIIAPLLSSWEWSIYTQRSLVIHGGLRIQDSENSHQQIHGGLRVQNSEKYKDLIKYMVRVIKKEVKQIASVDIKKRDNVGRGRGRGREPPPRRTAVS